VRKAWETSARWNKDTGKGFSDAAKLSRRSPRDQFNDETGNVIETHEHAGQFKEWSAFA